MSRTSIGKIFVDESNNKYLSLIGNGITGNKTLAGIRSKNTKQEFAMDALLDPDIGIVTLQGKAGTGKTLLALAASIHLSHLGNYNRVTITRPIISVGRDMGALPGGVSEKMNPWMQAVHDAIDVIKERDGWDTRV